MRSHGTKCKVLCVTLIADAVAVGVQLGWVGDVPAVVEAVHDPITVGVDVAPFIVHDNMHHARPNANCAVTWRRRCRGVHQCV